MAAMTNVLKMGAVRRKVVYWVGQHGYFSCATLVAGIVSIGVCHAQLTSASHNDDEGGLSLVTDPGQGVDSITLAQTRSELDLGRGVGTVGKTKPEIIDPGRGVGAVERTKPEIVDPGRGVGAVERMKPEIVDPGRGVGAVERMKPEIVDHGGGVGAVERSRVINLERASGDTQQGANLDQPAYVQIIINQFPMEDAPTAALVERNGLSGTLAPAGARAVRQSWIPTPSTKVTPATFMNLDTGLRDCDISFDDLKTKSSLCSAEKQKDGERCETFSYNQFPEVVKVYILFSDETLGYCSGTLISSDLVLTAAHCFLGPVPAHNLVGMTHEDVIWNPGVSGLDFVDVVVEASNAKMLPLAQRQTSASRVIVNGDYGGDSSDPLFQNDIALIKLHHPYPLWAVQPASLATAHQFRPESAIAGYGYSNSSGGEFGQFNVTWPVPLTSSNGELQFSVPNGETKSAFCQGDSGGPVFAGRARGCKPSDSAPEPRPHLIEGTISFNSLGAPDANAKTENQRKSSQCRNATIMAMQDVTLSERRQWICHISGNTVGGC